MKERWDKLIDLVRNARKDPLKRSMLLSAMCKPVSMVIAFFYTPLLLRCLGEEGYGVWGTILSVINWINYFDVGIGLGLRNTLTRYITADEKERARAASSTGYMSLTLISGIAALIGGVLVFVLDLGTLFKTSLDIRPALFISLMCVCINFVLGLIKVQYYAVQKAEKVAFMNLWGQIFNFVGIWILTLTGRGDLLPVAVIIGITGIVINLVYSGRLWHVYDYLRPVLGFFKREELGNVCGIGIKFFFLQINALVIFATDNMIISHIFGPTRVTPYITTYNAFGLINGLFTAFIAPLWSKYTAAQEQGDFKWIRRSILKLDKMLVPMSILFLVSIFLYRPAAKIWLRKELIYPKGLITCMAIYVFLMIWNNIYTTFLNGVGELNVQLTLGLAGAIANIPLSIWLGRDCGLESTGVILATVICVLVFNVAQTIQTHLYIHRKLKEQEASGSVG
ncbi:Membrane protein involved in the export of O-antigen and teichoic acid [Lachnospiraceae bacterium XBB2008]|nr:Membrane protein involved in the export of O-antigen and teichoic acid [Lachnospiraceae bacterium XBB2008]